MKSKRWRLLVFLPLAAIPLLLSSSPGNEEVQDLYSQPQDYPQFVSQAFAATYEIKCAGEWVGTGWGLQMQGELFVVTAHHVIEDCEGGEQIFGRNAATSMFELELISYDGRYWTEGYGYSKDVALLRPSRDIQSFQVQREVEQIGQWVAVVGYPANGLGDGVLTVNEGRLTGIDKEEILVTDAPINKGNSGGPMLNSKGQVLGTVFAGEPSDEFENMGYAQSLGLHCGVVFDCSGGLPVLALPEDLPKYGKTD